MNSIPFYEEIITHRKNFNMVNTDNKKLTDLGLTSLYIELIPLYFTPNYELYYSTDTNHYETNINNYVKDMLSKLHGDFESLLPFTDEEKETFYKKRMNSLKEFNSSSDLSGEDVLLHLNYNANLFINRKLNWSYKGVYNNETLQLINLYIRIKKDITTKIYNLYEASDDFNYLIYNLISLLKIYKNESLLYNKNEKIYYNEIYKILSKELLVLFLGYSKIETILRKTITTTVKNPNEVFYNYKLMDFDIVRIPSLIYDKNTNEFKIEEISNYSCTLERELEDDIELIKKYVPYNKRDKFLI